MVLCTESAQEMSRYCDPIITYLLIMYITRALLRSVLYFLLKACGSVLSHNIGSRAVPELGSGSPPSSQGADTAQLAHNCATRTRLAQDARATHSAWEQRTELALDVRERIATHQGRGLNTRGARTRERRVGDAQGPRETRPRPGRGPDSKQTAQGAYLYTLCFHPIHNLFSSLTKASRPSRVLALLTQIKKRGQDHLML